jgi:hypothetical protein
MSTADLPPSTAVSTASVILAVVLAASGCATSSSSAEGADVERAAHAEPTSSVRCPTLTGDVPPDLVRHRPKHEDEAGGFGPSTTVTFNNRATRELSMSTASSDEPVGEGLPGVRRNRSIDGVKVTEVVSENTRTFMWQQEDASNGCSYWSLSTVGLTDREVERALASIRESG